jgi:hypothetical protein
MKALVSVDCATGALRRYERVGDGTARLTHAIYPPEWPVGQEWEAGSTESFRIAPAEEFAITETPMLKPDHDAPWRCDPNDVA